jgi:peptidoglycan/LPS O-acetylase OafA/YrhL
VRRFPLLDSLRAFAALCVVVFHTAFVTHEDVNGTYGPLLAHLNVGVPIFFVISGFLLYRQFLGERPPALGTYVRHRALRIVPAYWVALTLLAIWPGLVGAFSGDWPIYYGFLQIYSPRTVLGGIPQAWTLGTELSFYALLPLYAWTMRRASVRAQLGVLGALAIGALLCRTYVEGGSHGGPGWGLSLTGTFDWFAYGMALAVVSTTPAVERLRGWARWSWVIGIGLYVVLAYALGLPSGYIFVQHYSFAQAFAVHLLSGLIGACVVLPAMFATGPGRLAWLGLVSYGIYLWHWNVIQQLHDRGGITAFVPLTAAAVAVTVALAAASYYLVERPALRFKDGFRGGPSRARGSAAAHEPEPGQAHP